ncbi:helix-turn-helix domain-containing protein [Pontibacillus salipaludis]|uniref:HTH cro/C1-type domain-containing protein n=1 Tax=Pontibacillus salipaludis TaxID=1697394 RepID=A0ABQ1PS91_9BACI|nr:helix-turn-helix transcriptional regulator [Pontibacillus salipaludis]GGD02330.1 hypothetical protein GCM10011389_07230 [Pontibacillus salipaludis]
MNGIEFGKYIKELRKEQKISSKVLSQKVGKAVTYVSQLERGLIKKPDFSTSMALLHELGFSSEKADLILNKKFEADETIDTTAGLTYKEDSGKFEQYHQSSLLLLDEEIDELKEKNNRFHSVMNELIERDFSRAKILIENLDKLTRSKRGFAFLSNLFSYDFLKIEERDKDMLKKLIDDFELPEEEIHDLED